MKLTTRQLQVSGNLERLVHHRLTEQDLTEDLAKVFNQCVTIEKGQYENDWKGDDYYTFCVDDEEIGGYFDIYILPTRTEGVFYITEVNYFFE